MKTPRTEAGRRLFYDAERDEWTGLASVDRDDIAAIEAEAGALDMRRVTLAIAMVAKRHGVLKDDPPMPLALMRIYGYSAASPDMDAEIAAEYRRLAEDSVDGS